VEQDIIPALMLKIKTVQLAIASITEEILELSILIPTLSIIIKLVLV